MLIINCGRLAKSRWFVSMSKSQRSLCVSFSRTDSGFWIYHLYICSNFNYLYNSQLITSTIRFCLVLYSFCTNLLHTLIMYLVVSSLSPYNQHLLFFFFCGLIYNYIDMVTSYGAFFCLVIRKDSVFLIKFPFLLATSTFSRVRFHLLLA